MDAVDLSWMLGRKMSVTFLEPQSWFFELGETHRISCECPWRLIREGRIAVSRDDHRQKYGWSVPIDAAERADSFLKASSIEKVEMRSGTNDLLIDFSGGLRLEMIPFSSGYESWNIEAPGEIIVAMGGGDIA